METESEKPQSYGGVAAFRDFVIINGAIMVVFVGTRMLADFLFGKLGLFEYSVLFLMGAFFFEFIKPTQREILRGQGFYTNFDFSIKFTPKKVHNPTNKQQIIDKLFCFKYGILLVFVC